MADRYVVRCAREGCSQVIATATPLSVKPLCDVVVTAEGLILFICPNCQQPGQINPAATITMVKSVESGEDLPAQ